MSTSSLNPKQSLQADSETEVEWVKSLAQGHSTGNRVDTEVACEPLGHVPALHPLLGRRHFCSSPAASPPSAQFTARAMPEGCTSPSVLARGSFLGEGAELLMCPRSPSKTHFSSLLWAPTVAGVGASSRLPLH